MGQHWHARTARLEAVLEYIDTHQDERLDIDVLSSLASLSPWHFHRVLSAHLGESVCAYVRRRRLEVAARRLLLEGAAVTDCSLDAGYASPAAFTRAFRRQFGASPRDLAGAMRGRAHSHTHTHARDDLGHPVFVDIEPVDVVAVRRRGPASVAAPCAWRALRDLALVQSVPSRRATGIGIPLGMPGLTPAHLQRYEACLALDVPPAGPAFRKRLAGGEHAVFDFRGPRGALQAAQESLLWNWYPASGLRLREAPVLQVFDAPAAEDDAAATITARLLVPIARPAGVLPWTRIALADLAAPDARPGGPARLAVAV